MAKTKPGKKDLDSYTIKGTNKIVRRIVSLRTKILFVLLLLLLFLGLHSPCPNSFPFLLLVCVQSDT